MGRRFPVRFRSRLVEIIRNLDDRITEARLNGWLGEVQGLQTSRDAAAKKLVALGRTAAQASHPTTQPANLGIPVVADASPMISNHRTGVSIAPKTPNRVCRLGVFVCHTSDTEISVLRGGVGVPCITRE